MLNKEYLTLIKVIGKAIPIIVKVIPKLVKFIDPVDVITNVVDIADGESEEERWWSDFTNHFK